MSFQRTATKCTLQMEPTTTIPDVTSENAVSDAMMLSPRPHQPHQDRLTPGLPDLCHSLPQPLTNTSISCTFDPKPNPAVPVSTPTAMTKVTPVPTPSSSPSVTPVQPQRSGCAHTAPKHLIMLM